MHSHTQSLHLLTVELCRLPNPNDRRTIPRLRQPFFSGAFSVADSTLLSVCAVGMDSRVEEVSRTPVAGISS